jgi:hypothetical protein
MKVTFLPGAALALLLFSPVLADTVIVPNDTTTVIQAPATTTVVPGTALISPGIPLNTPSGSVLLPSMPYGSEGFARTAGGGTVRYWTAGSGASYYQYTDPTGHREHRHRL